ncbi:MAG TPA: hypothetical protein VJK51_02150 [Candidatus Nanoarchaeia archaeon]|nr:hypothetical protein [Candidatus Nanoarchaeia archaeon]
MVKALSLAALISLSPLTGCQSQSSTEYNRINQEIQQLRDDTRKYLQTQPYQEAKPQSTFQLESIKDMVTEEVIVYDHSLVQEKKREDRINIPNTQWYILRKTKDGTSLILYDKETREDSGTVNFQIKAYRVSNPRAIMLGLVWEY